MLDTDRKGRQSRASRKIVQKMHVFTYILPPPPPPRSILNNLKQRHSTHEKMCNIWTQRLQGHNERYY